MSDNSSKTVRLLLCIITVLLLVNLVGTGWIATKVVNQNSVTIDASETLPEIFNDKVISGLYDNFEEAINSENYQGLYNSFDPFIKPQLDFNDLIQLGAKFRSSFGSLSEGAYSHYEYLGSEKGRDWYNIIYIAKSSGGKLATPSVEVTIGVITLGETYGISKYNIKGNF
ncbi:hypothetical protein [Kiloniella sp.]|uniref:hypothetical protein n=1 Tax=Kiloniella sp. TaxID=1938587 RepID=UPI003B01D211